MQQLLAIANIDDTKLKSILDNIAINEPLNISKACYFPIDKKYFSELMAACGLTKKDIEEFAQRTWSGRFKNKRIIMSDPFSLFLTWLMRYFLNQGDAKSYKSTLITHLIRQYGMLGNKYFPTCDRDRFNYALETISTTHLFNVKRTISGAIEHLGNEMGAKYADGIKNWNLDKISIFIMQSNRRINQSLKSFANAYYKIEMDDTEYAIPSEEERYEEILSALDPSRILINEVLKLVIQKGVINQQALNDAKEITNINMSTATILVNELSNQARSAQYSNDLDFILDLFLRRVTQKQIREDKQFILVRQLMAIKKTADPVYFKKQVHELLLKLVRNSGFENDFTKLTPQTQSLITLFLAFYITMVLRNLLN